MNQQHPNQPHGQWRPPQTPPPPQGQWPTPDSPYGPYYAQRQAPPKRRKWPWIVGGAALLFVAIGIANPPEEVPPVSEVNESQAAPPPPAEAAREAREATSSVAEAPAESEAIGSGTFIVGEDIETGTYKSTGAEVGLFEFCSWSTRSGASSNSGIIDIGSANADEQQIVEITDSVKAFESNGCEPWIKAK